jgi:serralysin
MSCPDFARLDACQCPKNINTKTVLPEDVFVCLAETPTISEMRAKLPYKDYTRVNLSKASEVRAAYLNSVKWKPGQTITVGFMRDKYFNADCVQTVQDVVNSTIAPHVNLKFVWDAPISESMIRISFGPPGTNSSWIGTGALRIDKSLPTMNLGSMSYGCGKNKHIIHEFGHALGMIHEHLRGDTSIKYDCPKMTSYLTGKPNFWSCKTIQDNVLDLKSVGEYDKSYSEYDPYSIMHYDLGDFRCDGGKSYDNSQLSPCDIFMLQKTYPQEGASPTGVCVIGPPLSRDENSIVAIIEENYKYALIAIAVTVGIIAIYNIAVHNKNKDNK